ncbi:uncharacterized protein K02A2.6-like [Rhagoletis pomonella]|uniref:uncharacterized protein K02A2.6-like n=1 Tax=Rhagoletis pomonella TaxID=28610 RepID=UPI0017823C4D|nr:uncharacterized protein K02A2.6-like [Rhagoletis pomonella]
MTSHRLQRWAIILMAYQYVVKYRKTTEHGNADALSRLPLGYDKNFDDEEARYNVRELYTPINAEIICRHAENDKVLKRVCSYVQRGWPEKLSPQDADLRPFFNHRFALTIKSNLPCLQTEYNRVIIPASLCGQILRLLHDGHWGVTKMKQLARRNIWWVNMDKDIVEMCSNCDICKVVNPAPARQYESWPDTNRPWERVHIDSAGPVFNSMWLICVDAFSQFPFIVQMTTTTTVHTISALSCGCG